MRLLVALLSGCLLLFATTAWAESAVELQILQEFFSPKGMENRSTRLTGAALETFSRRPMAGEYLAEGVTTDFRLLSETENAAIYEAVVTDDGLAQSSTAFFQRGPLGSKLEAIASLHLPPYLAGVEYPRLRSLPGRSAVQEARLKQLQRLLMSTQSLKDDFSQNRAAYENIAKLVESGHPEEAETAAKGAGLIGVRLYGQSRSEGEMALLGSGQGDESVRILGSEVRIAGFLDGVLGLLHLSAGVTPPSMSPKDYIFVDVLADNWYLFRNIAAEPLKDKSASK